MVRPSARGKLKIRISMMQSGVLILERGNPGAERKPGAERNQGAERAVGHGVGQSGEDQGTGETGGRGHLGHKEGEAEEQRDGGIMAAETKRQRKRV